MAAPVAPRPFNMKGNSVNRLVGLGALWALLLPVSTATADLLGAQRLERANRKLHGHVIDYTQNHGADRRLWSAALHEPRDLYVYVPPGFDPHLRYPVMLWLHGFAQDEHSFLRDVIEPLDEYIACGKLPPMIVAAPDGSFDGQECLLTAGSFFLNSKAGCYEDYVIQDVWGFLQANYPIRPEREAHILAGVSMGGGAAFNLGIKHRACFKVVIGLFAPLNHRWVNCRCRYMANFDPCCWAWRASVSGGGEVVGRFFGVVTIHLRQLIGPLYGQGPDAVAAISRENPIEMIDRLHLQEGELAMYVAYGGRDQFNLDAQVESFLFRAKERGLCVSVGYDPKGKHDRPTARRLLPGIIDWLGPVIGPWGPVPADAGAPACPVP